jgi:hypothetical protein
MTAGLGPYLRGLVRRKAPAGRGIIASFVSPGVYMVTLETSKWPVRATVAQAGATFAIGQVVWLMQSDATGATQNTEYIIGGLANSTSKNASVNQGYETTPFVLAPSVSVISPNPCPLVHGGAAVTVSIRGVNFTKAPTYGNALITNSIPAVVTSTLITINPVAALGLAPGLYDLTLEPLTSYSLTVPRFFVVT